MNDHFEKTEMTTLVSCTNHLLKEGFTENFVAQKTGIEAPSSKKLYIPSEVKIVNYFRFEGESDPADNAVLYAIEANDGTKGLLVDGYGAYANPLAGQFIKEVDDITKKAHSDVGPHCKTETGEEDDPEKRIREQKEDEDQNSNL
jgi:hypothetical protein